MFVCVSECVCACVCVYVCRNVHRFFRRWGSRQSNDQQTAKRFSFSLSLSLSFIFFSFLYQVLFLPFSGSKTPLNVRPPSTPSPSVHCVTKTSVTAAVWTFSCDSSHPIPVFALLFSSAHLGLVCFQGRIRDFARCLCTVTSVYWRPPPLFNRIPNVGRGGENETLARYANTTNL